MGEKVSEGRSKSSSASPTNAAPERDDVQVSASPLRCPFCHDQINTEGEEWVACEACLARHHEACWSEGARCSACGGETALVSSRKIPRPSFDWLRLPEMVEGEGFPKSRFTYQTEHSLPDPRRGWPLIWGQRREVDLIRALTQRLPSQHRGVWESDSIAVEIGANEDDSGDQLKLRINNAKLTSFGLWTTAASVASFGILIGVTIGDSAEWALLSIAVSLVLAFTLARLEYGYFSRRYAERGEELLDKLQTELGSA